MTAICDLSAAELVAAYRSKALSPVEATKAALERIEAFDGAINAVVLRWFDHARAVAAEVGIDEGHLGPSVRGEPVIFDLPVDEVRLDVVPLRPRGVEPDVELAAAIAQAGFRGGDAVAFEALDEVAPRDFSARSPGETEVSGRFR